MMKTQYVVTIAATMFSVWWMQAEGYEKGMARWSQEMYSCFGDDGVIKHPEQIEYFNSCLSRYTAHGVALSTVSGRLYEFLVR
jgi:hypothetical protein